MLHKRVHGGLYSSSFDLLDREITQCFLHAEGPGALPARRTTKNLHGLLSPSGPSRTVGQISAWAYKEMAEAAFPDVFVVIGKGEKEGFFTYLFSGWETPFGLVHTAKEEGQELIALFPPLRNDALAFASSDAIASQLPFLQFANRDKLSEIVVLPLLVNTLDYPACLRLGEALGDLGEQHALCIIGSSNLYGDAVDHAVVEGLKSIDVKKIHDVTHVNKSAGDLLVFAEAMKSLFVKQGKLLHYTPGHAAMVF